MGRASAGLWLGRERERVGPETAQAVERESKRFFFIKSFFSFSVFLF
jgi:hypothetical protein